MTARAQEQPPVLEMRHISKTFFGLRVLKNETALKSDTMIHASASQDPHAMAQQAVDVGYGIMNGKKPENPMVLMPSLLITRDNVQDYKGWSSPR